MRNKAKTSRNTEFVYLTRSFRLPSVDEVLFGVLFLSHAIHTVFRACDHCQVAEKTSLSGLKA